MKTSILTLALVAATLSSCTKEKTTVIDSKGNTSTTTEIGMDDEKVDSAKIKINDGLERTGEDIKKGAKELGENMKEVTSDAAAAVERSAKKVKEDTKK